MCDMMPSRDVMTSAAAAAAAAEKPKLLSLDVEHLVSEIKENLRLSGFKSRRNRTNHFARVKPYTTRPAACESCAARRPCRCDDDDDQANNDPYEMLQALLREGSLIKEAVRRLQIGLSPKQSDDGTILLLSLIIDLKGEKQVSFTPPVSKNNKMTCISQDGKFSLGEHTLAVPMELYKLNRERLCKRLSEVVDNDAYVLLQGGSNISHYCTDVDYIFRQEPYFHWTFGVSEPDCYGLIQVSSGEVHLFFPRVEEAQTVWLGKPLSLDEYKCRYKVNYASYADTLGETLNTLKPSVILTLYGKNTDSDMTCKETHFEGIDRFTLDNKILHKIIADCRVIKTDYEKEVMRYATKVTCNAHKSVMAKCKPDMYEYQCEANFLHYAYYVGGCRHVGYNNICCSGINGAVLHYGHATEPNSKEIHDGDMCLFDMGASYSGYTADVTVSFPANGKFTNDQRAIYNTVLAASLAVMNAIKPGVSWVDMHILANKVMLRELREIDLLRGDVDEMYEAGLAAIFQPHGLGHLLGIDVHDVGGYLEGYPDRPLKPGVKALRTARNLEVGMALTVEPGCYFIEPVLKQALSDPVLSRFLNEKVLKRFWKFGGVRIEDNIFVTERGIENYTPVPRTVEEIEEWMSKKETVA